MIVVNFEGVSGVGKSTAKEAMVRMLEKEKIGVLEYKGFGPHELSAEIWDVYISFEHLILSRLVGRNDSQKVVLVLDRAFSELAYQPQTLKSWVKLFANDYDDKLILVYMTCKDCELVNRESKDVNKDRFKTLIDSYEIAIKELKRINPKIKLLRIDSTDNSSEKCAEIIIKEIKKHGAKKQRHN